MFARYAGIALLLLASPVHSKGITNGQVDEQAELFAYQTVEKICKPFIASNGEEMLPFYVGSRIKDKEIAFMVVTVCKGYIWGYTERMVEEKDK